MTNEEMREMLQFAAKACGMWPSPEPFEHVLDRWNPRHDDGDCARMEAQLEIDLMWTGEAVWADFGGAVVGVYFHHHNNDRSASRRLASTRVAAGIGRRMK